MTTQDQVGDLIKRDTVVIFSKSYCPFCKKVIDFFASSVETAIKKAWASHKVYDLTDAKYTYLTEELCELTKVRTVPQVFVNGKFLGGCSEVLEMNKRGTLKNQFE